MDLEIDFISIIMNRVTINMNMQGVMVKHTKFSSAPTRVMAKIFVLAYSPKKECKHF